MKKYVYIYKLQFLVLVIYTNKNLNIMKNNNNIPCLVLKFFIEQHERNQKQITTSFSKTKENRRKHDFSIENKITMVLEQNIGK